MMASITKRGNTWQYTVSRMVDGKYKPIRKGGFRTKKEDSVAAAQIEADLANGRNGIRKEVSFAEYFLQWFQTFKTDIKPITMNSYNAAYNKIFAYFGEIPIQKITKRDYQKFLNEQGEIKARDTNKKLNGYIRSCVTEAIEERLIETDFTRNVAITGAEGKDESEKFIDYKSSQLLLENLHMNLNQGIENIMLMVALTTGLRFGEIVGLRIPDLDFKNNLIKVRNQWLYKEGGGFGDLKNKMSRRTISVDRLTIQALFQHIDTVKNHPQNEYNLVFFEPTSPIAVMTNDRLNDLLKSRLKELNITPTITVHGLRHTHSSILLYQGVSVLYVSERLGHADIQTTTARYSHILKELRERESVQSANIFEKIYQVAT